MREWFISELRESLVSSVHDVQMILNYLATRGDLDMDHVGMFGEGSGATIAILAAAVEPRLKVLDLLDPWGDWPDWLSKSSLIPKEERADFLKPEFLKQVELLEPIKWLPQLQSRTLRLQDALYDKVTPSTAKKRIESAMPASAQIVRYKDSQALGNVASAFAVNAIWVTGPSNSRRPCKLNARIAKMIFCSLPLIDVGREAIPLNDFAMGITQRFAHRSHRSSGRARAGDSILAFAGSRLARRRSPSAGGQNRSSGTAAPHHGQGKRGSS